MSNDTNNDFKPTAPAYFAYQVIDGEQANYWTRIGAAWPHKDNQGLSLRLDCVPLDGRIALRVATQQ